MIIMSRIATDNVNSLCIILIKLSMLKKKDIGKR